MADLDTHRELARRLLGEAHRAAAEPRQWPVAVDAGFYAVFHAMEALNAIECRDAYTFADALDILERVLAPKYLGDSFVADYEYLFYFRRGALYGPHFPSRSQVEKYLQVCDGAFLQVDAVVRAQIASGSGGEKEGENHGR